MRRARWIGVAAAAVVWCAPAVAYADPAVPQPDTPCPSNFSDAMTWPADHKRPLVCEGNRWQVVTSPYPVSDRWVTYGPAIKLHGEGLRNASIASGDWVATPQDPTTRCRAEQYTVVDAGVVGPPQVAEGPAGQPLSFRVLPKLFSVTMSGYCLWVKAAA